MKKDEHHGDIGKSHTITRRDFLKLTTGAVAAAGLAGVAGGYGIDRLLRDESTGEPFVGTVPDQMDVYSRNVPPPPAGLQHDVLTFFTVDEAETIDALSGTLLPGTPEDPGAREAGVVIYIDRKLSTRDFQFVAPTYFEPPFATSYQGDSPPQTRFQQIYVSQDQFDRYGFQSRLAPRDFYRAGILALNTHSRAKFGSPFAQLSTSQQEQIVTDLEAGNVPEFSEPSASDFFEEVREDVAEGMFSDPAYGGNVDMVGWELVGYPGAQRAYTPEDMLAEDVPRPPQSLAQMHAFNPGTGERGHAIHPVSDSDPERETHPGQQSYP